MATPVYAQHLIRALKLCGLDQNTIARRLSTNKTSVSWWATGQRPVGKRHVMAFLRLVEETMRLAPDSKRGELAVAVLAWEQELHLKVGDCQRAIRRHLAVLQSPYARHDPLRLSRSERRRLARAAKGLAEELEAIDMLEEGIVVVTRGPFDSSKPTPEDDPLVELARVAAMYHIMTEEEEDEP
jgi:hypothetical protein